MSWTGGAQFQWNFFGSFDQSERYCCTSVIWNSLQYRRRLFDWHLLWYCPRYLVFFSCVGGCRVTACFPSATSGRILRHRRRKIRVEGFFYFSWLQYIYTKLCESHFDQGWMDDILSNCSGRLMVIFIFSARLQRVLFMRLPKKGRSRKMFLFVYFRKSFLMADLLWCYPRYWMLFSCIGGCRVTACFPSATSGRILRNHWRKIQVEGFYLFNQFFNQM